MIINIIMKIKLERVSTVKYFLASTDQLTNLQQLKYLFNQIQVITNTKVDSHIGQELLRNELFALRSLNSEHILKFHQYIYTANNQYLITEYCDQGDLTNCFGISSSDVKCILKQILLGLLELRNKGNEFLIPLQESSTET